MQSRSFASIQPEDTVYSGPQAAVPRRVTLKTIRQMYARNEALSMVTAYDYPSAVHVSCIYSNMSWLLSDATAADCTAYDRSSVHSQTALYKWMIAACIFF